MARQTLIWAFFVAAIMVPVVAAGMSPLLAWRDPIYIVAGFAGIAAMLLLLIQPLLAAGDLPGLVGIRGRRMHRWVGIGLVVAVVVHVVGLWLTSPPDVVDALAFSSPTPFSVWGVIAMWAVFAAAGLAMLRRRLRLHPRIWLTGHMSLTAMVVGGTVVHAMLIDGTMEWFSKAFMCAVTLGVTIKVIFERRSRLGIKRS